MRCETAERELSARLDAAADHRLDASLDVHLATCSRCRAYESGARRLRELVRFEPAPPVPDLVPRIMDRLRVEGARPSRVSPEWRRVAIAFAASALVAALIVGGLPGLRRGPRPALATEIPRRIAAASSEVHAFRATFDIVERNFRQSVPVRRFEARIAFGAPERFHARIDDRTDYPSARWPRNDLVVAVDRDTWFASGPAACPREGLPDCATGERETRSVVGREPFDGEALLPTDIVLPVRTLSGSERVRVAALGQVLGRPVATVELAYRDSVPLFAYLHAAGSWRPFFPSDRVRVSLDRETWFPLAYEVRAAGAAERDGWALRNGLPRERPNELLFRASARSFLVPTRAEVPAAPGETVPMLDQGFRDVSFEDLASAASFDPIVPGELAGLEPYRAGIFAGADRPADELLLSFARGLSWLKIRQTPSWTEPSLYGDVMLPVRVALPGGGTAYYEPATATLGRRLSVHAEGLDVYLETNLPRDRLLEIAASLPVRGAPVPQSWLVRRWPGGVLREQVSLDRAVEASPDLLLPRRLPSGYRLWTIVLGETGGEAGVTVYFRRPGAELDGVGIRVHQATGTGLPPPLEADVLAVQVGEVPGRYSPTRGELEWVKGGVYRSIRASGLGLSELLDVATSLAPSEEAR